MNLNVESYIEFNEQVLDYLEYIGYPEMIIDYEPEAVALAMHNTSFKLFMIGTSYRMTALVIFALTFEKIKFNINIIRTNLIH